MDISNYIYIYSIIYNIYIYTVLCVYIYIYIYTQYYVYIYINYKYLSHTMLLNFILCINSPIHWISKPGRFGRPSRSLLRLGSSDRWQFGAAAGVPRALCSAAHGAPWDLSSENGDSSRDLTIKIGTEPSNMWIFNIQNWDVTWCNRQNIQKKMDLTSTSTDSTWLTHWILEMEFEDSAWFSNPFGVSDVFLTFVQSGRWYGNFLLSSIFGIGMSMSQQRLGLLWLGIVRVPRLLFPRRLLKVENNWDHVCCFSW
jgi:hypothetical protein